MSGVGGKLRILHSSLCGEYVAPSLSLFICITACVAVVDGQRGTFNNVIGQIKTPGQQKGTSKYGMHIWSFISYKICHQYSLRSFFSVFPGAIQSRQAQEIDSMPKRLLHGARQPWRSAALQPPVWPAQSFNMGVDWRQLFFKAWRCASASGVNPALVNNSRCVA